MRVDKTVVLIFDAYDSKECYPPKKMKNEIKIYPWMAKFVQARTILSDQICSCSVKYPRTHSPFSFINRPSGLIGPSGWAMHVRFNPHSIRTFSRTAPKLMAKSQWAELLLFLKKFLACPIWLPVFSFIFKWTKIGYKNVMAPFPSSILDETRFEPTT